MVDLVKIRKKKAKAREAEQAPPTVAETPEPEAIPPDSRQPTADTPTPSTPKLDQFKATAGQRREGFFEREEETASAEQVELLTFISAEKSALGRFFKLAKDLTIEGYYTSKPGLTVELGGNANTFLPEFKGCTHPEHQT